MTMSHDQPGCPRSTSGTARPPLLDDALWSGQLAAWSADLPRPKAILIVSAHWESAPVMLSAPRAGHAAGLRLRRLRAALLRDDLRRPPTRARWRPGSRR